MFMTILAASWSVFGEMAPYLLLGFFVAGVLSVYISPEWVERHLGGKSFSQVFKASVFGVPLPLCSCGVLPVAASLRRHGAGKGATTAFLLSTPQTGVDSIAVTYALLGPFLAVFRPVAALITGFVGGGAVQILDANGDDESTIGSSDEEVGASACCNDGSGCDDSGDPNSARSWIRALRYGFITLPRDIGKALFVGVIISGVISAVVEPDMLKTYLGGGVWPLLVAMAIGVPLYVCATASTPIALGLIHAGLSPGAAIAFLISGPATNGAALATLWKVLGRRTAVIYLVTVAVAAVGSGLAVDAVLGMDGVPMTLMGLPAAADEVAHAAHQHGGEAGELGGWLQNSSAVILLLVLAGALWPRRPADDAAAAETSPAAAERLELQVKGMRCNGCVTSLTRALSECGGVDEVKVHLDQGRAVVTGLGVDRRQVAEAVASLGFELGSRDFLEA